MKSQKGYSNVFILAAIGVVAIIGFAGWRVYDATLAKNTLSPSSATQSTATNNASIESVADVAAVEQELDTITIDSDLDTSSLDAEIKELQ